MRGWWAGSICDDVGLEYGRGLSLGFAPPLDYVRGCGRKFENPTRERCACPASTGPGVLLGRGDGSQEARPAA